MRNIKFTFPVLLLLFLTAYGFSQTPNLSGTWVLDKSKSDTGLSSGPLVFSGKIEFPDTTLVITHKEPEIRVSQTTKGRDGKTTEESVYYSDGTPGTEKGNKDPKKKPVARWDNGLLVIETASTMDFIKFKGNPLKRVMTETWEISANGKTLTQRISWKNEANLPGAAPMTKVFKKKS